MSHLASPGRILIGNVAPWTEETHGELPDGTLWLDTSVTPPQLRVRLEGQRAQGRPVGQNEGNVRALLTPILAAITDLIEEIAALKARLDVLEGRG